MEGAAEGQLFLLRETVKASVALWMLGSVSVIKTSVNTIRMFNYEHKAVVETSTCQAQFLPPNSFLKIKSPKNTVAPSQLDGRKYSWLNKVNSWSLSLTTLMYYYYSKCLYLASAAPCCRPWNSRHQLTNPTAFISSIQAQPLIVFHVHTWLKSFQFLFCLFWPQEDLAKLLSVD